MKKDYKYSKQITLGFNSSTGRRIRTRVYADSPSQLIKAERQAVADFQKKASPDSMTFEQYADKWFSTYCSKLSPATVQGYKNAWKKCKDIKEMRMQEITRSHLQTVINDNWEYPFTCKKIKVFFTALFRAAEIDGVIQKNPSSSLKIPRTPEKRTTERRAFTQEEIDAIQNAEFDPQERLFVSIEYQFGLRPGEAYALNYEDFDIKNKVLTIKKAVGYDGDAPFIKSTKTHATRQLPIPDEFCKTFPSGSGLMFPNRYGKLMTKSQADDYSEKIIDKINAQMGGTKECRATDITMYFFRHNKATQLYYLPGISNKAKAKYMGHSEEIFIRTYSHIDDQKEDISVLAQPT